jgi:hypothetical protein
MKKASKDHLLILGSYSNPMAVNIHPYFIVFRFDSDFYLSFIWGVLYGVFKKTNTDLFLYGLKHDKNLDMILQIKVKNPGPEDLALIYPQRRFVLPVISVFFGIME